MGDFVAQMDAQTRPSQGLNQALETEYEVLDDGSLESKDQKSIEAFFKELARPAYIPETTQVAANRKANSKFGGLPTPSDGMDWPQCPNCNKAMSFLLQLNGQELPKPYQNSLLSQLFQCTQEDCSGELEKTSNTKSSLVMRDVPLEKLKQNGPIPEVEILPQRDIFNWEQTDDYPSTEDLEAMTIPSEIREILKHPEFDNSFHPKTGEKLGGWPCYSPGLAPHTEDLKPSDYMVQIDSHGNLPINFNGMQMVYLIKDSNQSENWKIIQ